MPVRLRSPDQLESELQVAGGARAGDFTEVGGDPGGAGLAETRRVRESEGFETELETHALLEVELFVGGEVPVEKAALAEDIAARAAEREWRRRDENSGVEVLGEAAGEARIGIANQIGATHDGERSGVGGIARIDDAVGAAVGPGDDAAEGPATEGGVHDAWNARAEVAPSAEGEIVDA